MINQIKLFIVMALCMTVPSWGVHAAAPEMPAFLLNVQGSVTTEQQAFLLENWDLTEIRDDLPATVDSHMMETLFPDEGIIPIDVTIELDNLSDEELEIALQDELFLGQDASFWNRTRIVLGGFIVIAGILMILMLFVAGGGGSGAGGGSGSGGGGGDSNNPPIIGGGPIGGGEGGGGSQCETITCFEGGGEGGQGSIPMNPEPSTLLLLGLGLLLPLLRRKV